MIIFFRKVSAVVEIVDKKIKKDNESFNMSK